MNNQDIAGIIRNKPCGLKNYILRCSCDDCIKARYPADKYELDYEDDLEDEECS